LKISQKPDLLRKSRGAFRDQQQSMHERHPKVFKNYNHCCAVLSVPALNQHCLKANRPKSMRQA